MAFSEVTTQTFILALVMGVVPSLFWLWFWLREDKLHPEPKSMILLAFLGGMIATMIAYPIERAVADIGLTDNQRFFTWVVMEELLKYAALFFLVIRSPYFDEPIDAVIYMITIALGFAALENTLFILSPLTSGDQGMAINLTALRFVGATLLHVASSALVGIFMTFAYFRPSHHRLLFTVVGIIAAIGLHTIYNLSIIESDAPNAVYNIFIGLWLTVLGVLLACERIKRLPPRTHVLNTY
jgi:RsiW-degrading membrane proteinase PrsW (M82 family)